MQATYENVNNLGETMLIGKESSSLRRFSITAKAVFTSISFARCQSFCDTGYHPRGVMSTDSQSQRCRVQFLMVGIKK